MMILPLLTFYTYLAPGFASFLLYLILLSCSGCIIQRGLRFLRQTHAPLSLAADTWAQQPGTPTYQEGFLSRLMADSKIFLKGKAESSSV
jgi:hypothetical protein